MVSDRRGMVEAELLPLLEFQELVVFAGLSKACRSMLTPNDARCVHFGNLFGANIDFDEPSQVRLNESSSFKAVMEIVAEKCEKLVSVPKIKHGNSYKRYDKEARTVEYLCYAGGNQSMWTEDTRYYNRNCPGTVFKKPCLVLVAG